MKNQFHHRSRHARRKGSVLYFVSGAVVTLLGCMALAIDYGVLIADKNYLQRVTDASALGGATVLPDTAQATGTATLVAAQNRFVDDAGNDLVITFQDNDTRIRVEAVRRQRLFFARIFGQSLATVRAHAIAGSNELSPAIGPIGITKTSFDLENPPQNAAGTRRYYDTQVSPIFTATLVNHQRESFDAGEFILFDLRDSNAKSPEHMMRQLAGLEPINIVASDLVTAIDPPEATALNARSQDDFLFDGMALRFEAAAGAPWFDIDPSQGTNYSAYVGQHYSQVSNGTEPLGSGQPFRLNPRAASFIVTDATSGVTNGTLNAPVRALAPIYIVRLYRAGNNTRMDYRYLPTNLGGSGSSSLLE